MTEIDEYTRGYCDAHKHIVAAIHRRADEMNHHPAKDALNVLASDLGRAGCDYRISNKFETLKRAGFK